MAFPPLGNSDHVVVSVSIDFSINSKQDTLLLHVAYDYSRADWDGLRDHLRDVPWEDMFKLSASAAASEFCKWVQVGIDVYIPHRKYQVIPYQWHIQRVSDASIPVWAPKLCAQIIEKCLN